MVKDILHIVLFLFSVGIFSQSEYTVVIPKDSLKIEHRQFDKNALETYKNNDDFNYKIQKREPTFLERVWSWIKRSIKKLLSYFFDDIKPAVGFLWQVLRILPYLIATLVLFFIIKFFLRVNTRNIIDGKSATPMVQVSEDKELIKGKDLPRLIEQAISEGNYRLAIRYYYLFALKNLSSKELINWQQEKTNEDYVRELTNNKLYANFKEITNFYDFAWYGNFSITKPTFLKVENSFKKLLKDVI